MLSIFWIRKLIVCALILGVAAPVTYASETAAEVAADTYASQELNSHPLHGNLPDYSLAPDALTKAQHLSSTRTIIHFTEELWGIAQPALLLWLGVIAWIRDRAVRLGGNRWLQGFAFFFLYLAASFVLELPLSLYEHSLQLRYGLSVQRWASWSGDQAKTFILTWIIGSLVVLLLFFVIRRFPRRWWLVFWAASIPLVLAAIYAAPYVNLLYDDFEPLQQHHPELVTQLEKVVAKGHMDIPPDRMFLMKASEKETTLNAYVTGFGASKRVVVWDTSLAKGTPDEVLFIFGHESGHYVLGHIAQGVMLSIAGIFVALYLGYRFVHWTLRRWGSYWRIGGQEDWGTLAVLMLAFSLISAVSEPLMSTLSRRQEHAADVYGQESIHGIVADPQTTARSAFEVLGTSFYDDPNPSPLVEFWTYDHPALGRRAAFAKAYDPWAKDSNPKYLRRAE